MTIAELARTLVDWLVAHQHTILLVYLVAPLVATAVIWMCKRARAHATGTRFASITIVLVVVSIVLEALVLAVARGFFDADLTATPVLLVIGPPLAAVVAISGIHCVYPLTQLAAWRSLTDIGWFVLAAAVLFWLVTKFRGWGIIFAGSLLELLVLCGLAYWLLRRLFKRAFSR